MESFARYRAEDSEIAVVRKDHSVFAEGISDVLFVFRTEQPRVARSWDVRLPVTQSARNGMRNMLVEMKAELNSSPLDFCPKSELLAER